MVKAFDLGPFFSAKGIYLSGSISVGVTAAILFAEADVLCELEGNATALCFAGASRTAHV
jgi:hypothetical protein